jgi:hypothetical protein
MLQDMLSAKTAFQFPNYDTTRKNRSFTKKGPGRKHAQGTSHSHYY